MLTELRHCAQGHPPRHCAHVSPPPLPVPEGHPKSFRGRQEEPSLYRSQSSADAPPGSSLPHSRLPKATCPSEPLAPGRPGTLPSTASVLPPWAPTTKPGDRRGKKAAVRNHSPYSAPALPPAARVTMGRRFCAGNGRLAQNQPAVCAPTPASDPKPPLQGPEAERLGNSLRRLQMQGNK